MTDALGQVREGLTHTADFTDPHGGRLKLFLTINFFADGRPAEVFIFTSKQGSILRGLFDSIAILISKSLTHGVPVCDLAHSLSGINFYPQGFTADPDFPDATSPVDWVIQRLIEADPTITEDSA